jgi:hypothetical protein
MLYPLSYEGVGRPTDRPGQSRSPHPADLSGRWAQARAWGVLTSRR